MLGEGEKRVGAHDGGECILYDPSIKSIPCDVSGKRQTAADLRLVRLMKEHVDPGESRVLTASSLVRRPV